MKSLTTVILISGVVLVAGCASIPTSPSLMALPGTGKNFEQFRKDDGECRQYAYRQIGGPAGQPSTVDPAVRSAAIGTAIGAAAGAAIGGSQGAGVGAGTGLVFGSIAGADASQRATYGSQRDYDTAYIQCMYARGHRVPVSASMARALQESSGAYSPPPAATDSFTPPPPPGLPPPPPPGY